MLQDQMNGSEDEVVAGPELPNPPAQPAPLELDVDAWYAQREPMIDRLKALRESLLEEVLEIERKLQVLGIKLENAEEEPEDEQEEASPPSRRHTSPSGKTARVLKAMTQRPEKIADISRRAGLSYSDTWRALAAAKQDGTVRCTGTKGKDVRYALA